MSIVVYLDQNKWIQLARVVNRKEVSPKLDAVVELAKSDRILLPLSAIHYMESSRISNIGRRQRLGKVMWDFSKGQTLLAERDMIISEVEAELSKVYPQIQPAPINLIGHGASHAFGMSYQTPLLSQHEDLFERRLVTGESWGGQDPIKFDDVQFRQNFQRNLKDLHTIKAELPSTKWDDAIVALCLADIVEPLSYVIQKHRLSPETFMQLGSSGLTKICENMPTRRIAIHLHREVLKNDQYAPKVTDLEDWAGAGIGAAYCDIVVCEKHFRDLMLRSNFKVKAAITNHLEDLLDLIGG